MTTHFKEYGIYIGALKILLPLASKVSIIYQIKKFAKRRKVTDAKKEKALPWVSEIIQIIYVFTLLLLTYITVEKNIDGAVIIYMATFVFAYRSVEISIFLLEWIFVAETAIHSYRRSVAGFLVNVFEISLISTYFSWLLKCNSFDNVWEMLYAHLQANFTFSPPSAASHKLSCIGLASTELVLSVLIVLAALASIVGHLSREQTNPTSVDDD